MSKKLSKKTLNCLKKTVANKNRRIARSNKTFEKMTPAEKRVQIARDVLAQLALKRLVPTPGVWLAGPPDEKNGEDSSALFSKEQALKNPELKSILNKTKECTGCALGGMFMCAVERADKLKLEELSYDAKEEGAIFEGDIFPYMEKFFNKEQLNKIESAFEQGGGSCSDYEASEWAGAIEDPGTRMRLIMENIILNKGTFNVNMKPQSAWIMPGFTY